MSSDSVEPGKLCWHLNLGCSSKIDNRLWTNALGIHGKSVHILLQIEVNFLGRYSPQAC